MTSATPPPGLHSQTRQGPAARFFHRIGGSVRRAIAGIARTTTQPPAPVPAPEPAPEPGRSPAAAAPDPQATATPSGRSPTPRRRRAAPPAAPSRQGWIARCLGRRTRQPAPARPLHPDRDDAPFTPETHPGFSAEVCAFLNTPVAECDPMLLRVALSLLARHIADNLPPELGLADPKAILATLWGRLGGPFDQQVPDAAPLAAPDAQPGEAPAAPPDEAPDQRPGEASDAPQADAPDSPADAAPDAPPTPAPPPETPAAAAPDLVATAAFAAPEARPLTALRPPPGRHRAGWPFSRGRHRLSRRRRASRPPGLRAAPPWPPRRLCYAACAGPP